MYYECYHFLEWLFPQYALDTRADDGFFDLLSRFQASRMDDQRCSLQDSLSSVPALSIPCESPSVALNNRESSSCTDLYTRI